MQPERQASLSVTYDCIPCAVGSLVTLFHKRVVPEEKQEPAMRALLAYFSQLDFKQSLLQMGKEMHRIIRGVLENPDPYFEIKRTFNQLMLEYYPNLKKLVEDAADPFLMALRLAIAGNVIDFGPNRPFDFKATLDRAQSMVLAVDKSESLKSSIPRSKTLLYLGDNAGEIVMDRILLETVRHPNVYFAVRGAPVINDATIDDARAVGIDKIAHIISNGDDAPGTILEAASPEFRDIFDRADLVIAKGQGNFEGLCGIDKNIYFILMAKCDHVAAHLGVRKGDLVVATA
ncbi:MAG: ARMT1-like domain-containing protein [Candidatus Aminicenantales bacterium]